jgi:4-amino-4-deoxy-L-arabinose transferase-like glycosyltransferase
MAFTKTLSPAEASTTIPARRLILCWALPVILLMSAVATKLPHYILPAFPALAIAAAIGVLRFRQAGPPRRPTGPAALTGLILFVFVGTALGMALTVAPWFLPVFGLRVPATGLGLLFLAITLAGAHYFRKGRHNDTVAVLITGMVLVLLSAALFLLPAIESFKLSPRLADCIETLTPPSVPVATCGYGEPSLNFYLNRGPIESLDDSQLAHWAARRNPGLLVITRPKLKKYHHLFERNHLHEVERLRGFNYSQGKWVTVFLVTREQRHD